MIERRGERYWLTDRGSVTGTYLNGEPVESRELAHEDRIAIGPYLLHVVLPDAAAPPGSPAAASPLELCVEQQSQSEPVAGQAAMEAPRADYAAAYRLRQRWLSKSRLTAAAIILGALALLYVPLTGHYRLLSPGPVSENHQTAATGCFDCHAPWRGPVENQCESCHQVAPHELVEVRHASCAECHAEHRGPQDLQRVASALCVSCHAGLRLEPGAATAIAAQVASFDAHPPFSPASDLSSLRFNHAVHAEARPTGAQLACADCHVQETDGTMVAVEFETNCATAGCHPLVFDSRFDEPAVHGDPLEAVRSVFGAYLGNFDELAALSRQELTRRIFRRGQTALSTDETAERIAFASATRMLEDQCTKCHLVEVASLTEVRLEAPVVRDRWMEGARFSHAPHQQQSCESCHLSAATSRATADVLLPDLAQCLSCHGSTPAVDAPLAVRAGSPCATCHDYHPTVPRTVERLTRLDPLAPAGSSGGPT